ncbi:MAG: HNH endonuclease [Methanomicrobiaceae archaeon]|nr:HNH endonuclease [Methanomicrobiaceae archaeon]
MDLSDLKKINQIIEHDKADATYKYALLRGVIEICQKNRTLGRDEGGVVTFPLGILVEKWILYYYPLFESSLFIPQKAGEPDGKHMILFRPSFEKLIEYYRDKGGFSAFYRDYVTGCIPDQAENTFLILSKEIRNTIANMPMKYLGKSYSNEEYSIFEPDRPLPQIRLNDIRNRDLFIRSGGLFSMSSNLASIFEIFGSFISGDEGILKKWAEFSAKMDKSGQVSESNVIEVLNRVPETGRSVSEARKLYGSMIEEGQYPQCVWSGREIAKMPDLAVDHMIPFAVWKNNDLWNLLPAHFTINSRKSDKIPAPSLIERRSDTITGYWELLDENFPVRFEREINVSLSGASCRGWREDAVTILAETCDYLIDVRGFEAWVI